MLTRKNKFKYPIEEDLLLRESLPVVSNSDFITHVELIRTTVELIRTTDILKGVYRYKPKTGVLSYINGDLCSVVPFANMKLLVAAGYARFLYHRDTFDNMIDDGEIIDSRSDEEKAKNPLRPKEAITKEVSEETPKRPKRRSLSI